MCIISTAWKLQKKKEDKLDESDPKLDGEVNPEYQKKGPNQFDNNQ